MPTKKPRINITLSQETYDTISSLAALQGVSRAWVVSDIMESINVPLSRTVALLGAAQDAPDEVKRGLAGSLEDIHSSLIDACGESNASVDRVFSEWEKGR